MNEHIAVREIPTVATVAQHTRLQTRFLKGPIPLRDIAVASNLPGQALAVLIAIHHRVALTRQSWVTLPKGLMQELGISRDSKARALRQLQSASLVCVETSPGTTSRISLLNTCEVDGVVRLPWRNSNWMVTVDGVRSLTIPYDIAAAQLAERRENLANNRLAMWPFQMADKSWVDLESFLEAFEVGITVLKPTGWNELDLSASFTLAREIAASRTTP